jgi:hypothetical protein
VPPPPDPAAPPDAVRPDRSKLLAAGALSLPALGFWLLFLGLFASLILVLRLVPWAGPRLWGPSRGQRRGVALLGFGAMWLPAVLAFFGVFYSLLGEEGADRVGSTFWLFIPLCAPEQPLVPTLVASAVYVAGAALSGVVHRPWPWVLGALLSALSYDLVMFLLSVDIIC